MHVLARAAVTLAIAVFLSPASAGAFAISGLAVAPESLNTNDTTTSGGNSYLQRLSSTSIVTAPGGPVPDTAGSTLSFAARYAASTTADLDTNGPTISLTALMDYSITFTVEDPLNLGYEMEIATSRVGAVTSVDDVGLGAALASADLSSVSATLDGGSLPGLGLPSDSWPFSISSGGTENEPFGQTSGPVVVTDVGTKAFVLRFTSTDDSVTSTDTGTTNSGGEVAIRMGLAGTLGNTTADNYPGSDSRDLSNDGHFVSVNLTLVPEPSTALLLASGLVLLHSARRRRR